MLATRTGDSAESARRLRDHLAAWPGESLLVFDNAASPDLVRPFLPAVGGTHVVITNTRREFAELGAVVDVAVFSRAESLGYLAARTGVDDPAGAGEVAAELGDLPLGLAQAAAVIWGQHLTYQDLIWRVRTKQRLFQRPGFARTASLAEAANSAEEFEARCNALSDVFSMLTVPKVCDVEGPLNLLKAAVEQHINDPDHLQRAIEAIDALRDIVTLRRGQAHSDAARESLKAADRLGVRLTGDWAESWDRVRQVTIEAIYAPDR